MSIINESLPDDRAAPRISDRIGLRWLAKRIAATFEGMTRRKQVYALSRLDDRALADIGVTRADLQEASRWSLWGDDGERLSALAQERREARERAAAALEPRRAA